jgi:hypothetical protein
MRIFLELNYADEKVFLSFRITATIALVTKKHSQSFFCAVNKIRKKTRRVFETKNSLEELIKTKLVLLLLSLNLLANYYNFLLFVSLTFGGAKRWRKTQ